jgi:hypothetical protein
VLAFSYARNRQEGLFLPVRLGVAIVGNTGADFPAAMNACLLATVGVVGEPNAPQLHHDDALGEPQEAVSHVRDQRLDGPLHVRVIGRPLPMGIRKLFDYGRQQQGLDGTPPLHSLGYYGRPLPRPSVAAWPQPDRHSQVIKGLSVSSPHFLYPIFRGETGKPLLARPSGYKVLSARRGPGKAGSARAPEELPVQPPPIKLSSHPLKNEAHFGCKHLIPNLSPFPRLI